MASEKEGQLITFICDRCDDTYEVNSHSWKDAWSTAKDQGWITFKDEDDEWQHHCPDCRSH